jgi:hypothetical protein
MPNTSSKFADEGTLAHEICAALVDLYLGNIDQNEYEQIDKRCREDELWDDDIYNHAYVYRDYIIASILDNDTIFSAVEVSRLSLEPWVPQAFGTADFVAFDGRNLDICDFKYGKGVAVSANNNPQLKLYALGAAARFKLTDKPGIQVNIHIIQPRIKEPDSYSLYMKDLLSWANDYVAPRAQKAIKGEGDYCPGNETCRFCRAKAVCKGLAEDIFAAVKDQPSIDTLTIEEVAANFKKSGVIKAWVQAMEEHLHATLAKGKPVPGWKLVEGRSNRKICDNLKAAELLRAAGFQDELTHKLTLIGITDLERLCGKKQLPVILEDTLIRPAGAPVLVDEHDPRPAYDQRASILDAFDNGTGA